jgi:hypothetical protein
MRLSIILAFAQLPALLCGMPARAQGRWTSVNAQGVYDSAPAACNAELKFLNRTGGLSYTFTAIAYGPENTFGVTNAVCGFVMHYPSGYSQPYPLPIYNWCGAAFKQSGYCDPARPSRIVTVTITGTVASGRDDAGIFGKPGADLAGKPFTAVYTFDDKKGAQQLPGCNAPVCYSEIDSLDANSPFGASSPGTVAVRIDGRASPTVGAATDGSAGTGLRKNIFPCCNYPMTYGMGLDVHDSHGGVRLDARGAASGPPATTDADWRSAFSDAHLARMLPPREGPASNFFSIMKGRAVQASGVVIPATICVSEQPGGCVAAEQR